MSDQFSFFEVFNALVDGGWLKVLNGLELAVLNVYLRFTDKNGSAWPSNSTLRHLIGHAKSGHVRQARASLIQKGWLVVEHVGGGNARETSKYRIAVPPCPDSGHAPITSMPGFGAQPCPDSGRNPARIRGTKELIEEHIEQPIARKRSRKACEVDQTDVERIWEAYPKKDGKPSGIKAIAKALDRIRKRSDAPANPVGWLVARVEAYARATKGRKPEHIKNPQGWFNDDRFDDETLDAGADNNGDDPMVGLGTGGWKRAELTPELKDLLSRPEPEEVTP